MPVWAFPLHCNCSGRQEHLWIWSTSDWSQPVPVDNSKVKYRFVMMLDTHRGNSQRWLRRNMRQEDFNITHENQWNYSLDSLGVSLWRRVSCCLWMWFHCTCSMHEFREYHQLSHDLHHVSLKAVNTHSSTFLQLQQQNHSDCTPDFQTQTFTLSFFIPVYLFLYGSFSISQPFSHCTVSEIDQLINEKWYPGCSSSTKTIPDQASLNCRRVNSAF